MRRAATMLRAVMRPVLGFSDGMFSIVMLKQAESDSTSMRWTLRCRSGSAQMSMVVLSGPMPANDSAVMQISPDVMGQGFSSLDNLRNWPDKKRVLASAAVQVFAEMRRICDEQGTKLIVAFIPCPFEFAWVVRELLGVVTAVFDRRVFADHRADGEDAAVLSRKGSPRADGRRS